MGGPEGAVGADAGRPPLPAELPLPLPDRGGAPPGAQPYDRPQPGHGVRTQRLPVSPTHLLHSPSAPLCFT